MKSIGQGRPKALSNPGRADATGNAGRKSANPAVRPGGVSPQNPRIPRQCHSSLTPFPLLKDAPAARRGRLHVTDTPFRQALLIDRLEKGSVHVVDLAESATTGYK